MGVCVFTASGIDSYYTKNVIRVEKLLSPLPVVSHSWSQRYTCLLW